MIRSCQMVAKQVHSLRYCYKSSEDLEPWPAASKEKCLVSINFKEFESCPV